MLRCSCKPKPLWLGLWQEDTDDKATSNPVIVMLDEDTGNRYMRLGGQKGLGK